MNFSEYIFKFFQVIKSPFTSLAKFILGPEKYQNNKFIKQFGESIDFLIIAAAIVFLLIRPYLVTPYLVVGESMYPTYHNWDYLFIDKFTYKFVADPKRGDVVVLKYPLDESMSFLKRIIALPGETIYITSTSTYVITPNGQQTILPEQYANGLTSAFGNMHLTLKDDEYFVMGDNREHSSDSRMWGPATRDEIVGRVLIRLFPFTKIEITPGY